MFSVFLSQIAQTMCIFRDFYYTYHIYDHIYYVNVHILHHFHYINRYKYDNNYDKYAHHHQTMLSKNNDINVCAIIIRRCLPSAYSMYSIHCCLRNVVFI